MSEQPERPEMYDRMDYFATGGNDHGYAFLSDDAAEVFDNTREGRQDGGRQDGGR